MDAAADRDVGDVTEASVDRLPRRDWIVLGVASVIATAPVWIATFPPMTDLPQHASQVALLRSMLQPDFAYAPYFRINWFTPYLLGYLLVYALVPLLGIVTACKAIVAIALAALPLATAVLMSETGADRRLALLTIPAMYGFSYHWGFLNFLVAAPIGLVFVWLALRQARRPTAAGALALAVGVNALFFCHAMICVFFGLVAGLILLASAKDVRSAILRPLPLASVVPMALFWASRTLDNPLARRPMVWDLNWLTTEDYYYRLLASWTTADGWGWGRTAGLLPRLLGTQPGLTSSLVGLALFLLPLAAGARFTKRPIVWVPLGVCAAVLMFLPGILFGTDFTFQRFTVFALPLFLITLVRPTGHRWPRWTWPAAVVLVAGWTGAVSVNAARYEAQAAGFDQVLSHMDPNARALSFAFERDSAGTIAPTFLHFPSWYGAVKGGIVDPNIAGTHVQLVLFAPGVQPAARLWGFEWNPGWFNWKAFTGEQYRYFVVRSPVDLGPRLFHEASCPMRLTFHVNHWWLYERAPECGLR